VRAVTWSICAAALSLASLAPVAARAQEPPAEPIAASWATTQATELSRQAREHAAHGEPEVAVARYVDAIKLDPTYGAAYLGLASVYEARGDVSEAERTYAIGIDHVPGFAEALMARARLRTNRHRPAEAAADLEAAVSLRPETIELLRQLAGAYLAAGALPAALAVTRRLAALAEAQQDGRAASEARVGARALALLVGDADPVSAGQHGRGPVRHALWLGARRK
jgi:tetratricopeptide (TPR) repeat protein